MRAIVDALEVRSIPWYLTGSEALAAYGEPRQTLDTDLVLATTTDALASLAATLDPRWTYAEPIHVGGRWMASLIDRLELAKVDLVIRDPDQWGEEAMRRRLRWDHPVHGPVWVCTLEDLVLAKLEWSDGTSELQLRDCRRLLALNRDCVDDPYLDRWASALGITDRLAGVRRAA